ncbi:MAG: trimethylamine methyltransferase family protein, partial [Alphaproteobacteria bacterium]
MSKDVDLKSRRGGRGERRALRTKVSDAMLPPLKRNMPLVEPMSLEEVEKIDNASMKILEEVGVVFRDDIAL